MGIRRVVGTIVRGLVQVVVAGVIFGAIALALDLLPAVAPWAVWVVLAAAIALLLWTIGDLGRRAR